MKSEKKFFVCKHCGNIVEMIENKGVKVVCCGEPMQEVTANTVDAATEKHIPVAEVSGDKVTVKVGSVEHPMLEAHFIEWIYLDTQKGSQMKHLNPGETPEVVFTLENDKPLAVYAYCNLHGLWKADL